MNPSPSRPLPVCIKQGAGLRRAVNRLILGFLLVVIGTFTTWRVLLWSQNRARLKAIASRGEPVDSVALDRSYKEVPDHENAALLWLSGCAEMTPPPKDAPLLTRFQFPRRGAPSTEEHLQYARSLVFSNQPALEIFHRAAALSKSRYPIDLSPGLVSELPHLDKLKSAAHLLSMEAFVASYDGRAERAVEAVLGNIALARSLLSEPALMSQLVRAYVDAVAFNSAGYLLNYAALTDFQLQTVGTAFAASEDPESLARAYIGERAGFVTMVHNPELMAPGLPASGDDEDKALAELPKNMRSPFIRATGFFQRDLAFFLDAMATNIAWAGLPDPQRFHAQTNWDGIVEQAKGGYYLTSGLLLPALNAVPRDVMHRARLRIAQVAMAIERHRLANDGRIPAELPALVPKYLPTIPVDPFDGQPIRFKRMETGYVVYSIGKDGKDDGGTEWRRASGRGAPEDITFIVERK